MSNSGVLATAAMGVSAIPGFFFRKKHPTLLHCIAAVFMLLVGAWTIACALEASSVGLAAKIKKYRTEYVSQADSPAHYAALFYGRLAMGALIAGLGLAALVVKIKENLPSKKHDKGWSAQPPLTRRPPAVISDDDKFLRSKGRFGAY